MSRRRDIHNFYNQRARQQPANAAFGYRQFERLSEADRLEKSAASAQVFEFHGEAVLYSVVVRSDLNGYSAWARDKRPSDRAALLDQFFSFAVPELQLHGGVYFRDEGDCIVGLFSEYFGRYIH